MRDVRSPGHRPGPRIVCLVAGVVLTVAACGSVTGSSAPSPQGSTAAATPAISVLPSGAPSSPEQALADAWAAAVDAHDAAATNLMIANPLAEYDLVGSRLIDLVGQTRAQLAALPLPPELREETRALDEAMADVLAQLQDIEPHGPRPDQATAFQQALDDWIDRVLPRAQAIRSALGLPPVPPGDLQL